MELELPSFYNPLDDQKKQQHTQLQSLNGLSQYDIQRIQQELSNFATPYERAVGKYWIKKGRPIQFSRAGGPKNIYELERLYYPYKYSNTFFQDIARVDDPVLTSSTNFLNTTYGEKLWSLLDMTQSLWRIFPKDAWSRRGWRFLDGRLATGGGVPEPGVLPDTDQLTTKLASTAPKTVIHTFDASLQAILEGQRSDDTWGDPIEVTRPWAELEHGKDINGYFFQDYDTLAGNNLESVDRLTSTTAGTTSLSYTAGDEDIFNIDKSATASLDVAYMDENGGSDRDFSLKRLDDAFKSVRRYWTNSPGAQPVWITGENTYERWNRELQPQQRFSLQENQVSMSAGLSGLQYNPTGNIHGGFSLGSYREWNGKPIPIVVDPDTPTDTIDRVYLMLLGTNATFVDILMPTQYYENGMSNGNPFLFSQLGTEGAFVTLAEMKSKNLRANAQIRDLQ